MMQTRTLIATAALASTTAAGRSPAQDIPPHLSAEEIARLRRLLARQEEAETRTPDMIEQIREQLRRGARRG